jgi:hypothetical protein
MGKACKKSGTPDEQDWTEFEGAYAATGRPPFSPRQMTGLILYGVMQGVHSLRELERLARWPGRAPPAPLMPAKHATASQMIQND